MVTESGQQKSGQRRHPDEFGRHRPHNFDGKQIVALLGRIFSVAVGGPAIRGAAS